LLGLYYTYAAARHVAAKNCVAGYGAPATQINTALLAEPAMQSHLSKINF